MNRSEQRFLNICLKKKIKTSRSSKDQDIYEHWDFKVNNSLVDVKGAKKISRSDEEFNYDIAWLEIRNVRGNLGWLKGKADFIAFEQKDHFLIVKRLDLLNWLKLKITNKKVVYSSKEALYRFYQRKNRKDIVCLVKIKDFLTDIKCWKFK